MTPFNNCSSGDFVSVAPLVSVVPVVAVVSFRLFRYSFGGWGGFVPAVSFRCFGF